MKYGQKIAELRKTKNLTQAELGAQLNVTAQAVSKWENGLSEPDIESVRKLCEIFGISVDEFLGLSTTKPQETTPVVPAPAPATRIINGYCEACHEPVGPGEYSIDHFTYDPNARPRTILSSETQHIYCNDCYESLVEIKKSEDRVEAQKIEKQKQIELKKQRDKERFEKEAKIEDAHWKIKKGLIWAAVICTVVTAILCGCIYLNNDAGYIATAIILSVGSFTFASQCIWDGFINDVMGWFCRSFTWPFGFIFELSLDGILWLLTVKLALWIISGVLSVIFFIVGLFFSVTVSLFSFPFVLIKNIRNANQGIAVDDINA